MLSTRPHMKRSVRSQRLISGIIGSAKDGSKHAMYSHVSACACDASTCMCVCVRVCVCLM